MRLAPMAMTTVMDVGKRAVAPREFLLGKGRGHHERPPSPTMACNVAKRCTRLCGVGRGGKHGDGGREERPREGSDACVHRHHVRRRRTVARADARIDDHHCGGGEA